MTPDALCDADRIILLATSQPKARYSCQGDSMHEMISLTTIARQRELTGAELERQAKTPQMDARVL